MATLQSLPEDIIICILSTLSVKSIGCVRCVCKLWYEFLKRPKFIQMHLKHAIQNNKFSVLLCSWDSTKNGKAYHTVDFDTTSSCYHMAVQTDLPHQMTVVTDACDGLIGLKNYFNGGDAILWNPSTREYENNRTFIEPLALAWYGVCYDWKIDDYKMFKVVTYFRGDFNGFENSYEVWVRRPSSCLWENIGNIPYNGLHVANVCKKPLNGIIHWIHSTKVIVSFDIVEERTKEIITLPCYLKHESYRHKDIEVGVLGENLYIIIDSFMKNIDLWVMKDYGVVDSWTRIFSLSKDDICYHSLLPLHYLNKSGDILLRAWTCSKEDPYEDVLVSYEPKNGRLAALNIPGKPNMFDSIAFVGSLVSLKSGEFVKAAANISKVDARRGI